MILGYSRYPNARGSENGPPSNRKSLHVTRCPRLVCTSYLFWQQILQILMLKPRRMCHVLAEHLLMSYSAQGTYARCLCLCNRFYRFRRSNLGGAVISCMLYNQINTISSSALSHRVDWATVGPLSQARCLLWSTTRPTEPSRQLSH